MSDERVYTRDASWRNRPRTTGVRSWHWPSRSDAAMSACGHNVLDNGAEASGREPAEVPADLRCGMPGCRQAWASVPVDA